MGKRLELGRTVVTCGVDKEMQKNPHFAEFVKGSLSRHARGDWGEIGYEEDRAANDDALESGEERILSVYEMTGFPKIWVITEWDRSVTTVLFPDEY